MGLDPATIGMFIELGLWAAKIAETAINQQAGQDVTDEQMAASTAEQKAALARLKAACADLEDKNAVAN